MKHHAPKERNVETWVAKTELFKQCRSIRKSIEEHKWYESEKAGYDIGWERATVDWLLHYGPDSPPPSV